MNLRTKLISRRARDRQSGQSLVMVMVVLIALLAAAGFVIDTGNLYYSYQQLQVATQAAALAGGAQLPNASAATTAATYSAQSGGLNRQNISAAVPTITTKCLTSIGIDCSATVPNAIVVTEQATVHTFFMRLFGVPTINLTATATASSKGGGTGPFNVEIILDTTPSMNDRDRNCTVPLVSRPTKEDCAVYGVQILLGALAPCSSTLTTCGPVTKGDVQKPVDEVGLMAFPGVKTALDATYDYDCSSSPVPAIALYNQTSPGPPVYQIVNFSSDYRTSDAAAGLYQSSNLVIAARAGTSGCQQGIDAVPNYNTFFRDAIHLAQQNLVNEQTIRKNLGVSSTNVIILVSDGQSNTDSAPSGETTAQCLGAASEAHTAAVAGTWVFSVAYGSTNGGCTTDGGSYNSSCYTMKQIANSPGIYPDLNKFYSDSGSSGTCPSSHNVTQLSDIFKDIAGDLTVARLLPNGTT